MGSYWQIAMVVLSYYIHLNSWEKTKQLFHKGTSYAPTQQAVPVIIHYLSIHQTYSSNILKFV